MRGRVWGKLKGLLGGLALVLGSGWASALVGQAGAQAAGKVHVRLGFPRCAHCLAMAMVQQFAPGVVLEDRTFANSNDVMTALLGGSLDMAQVTYLNLVSIADQNFPLVAVSGQVNGGSDFILARSQHIRPGDWAALKREILADAKAGHPFRIASTYGTAQDIEIRGELLVKGIQPTTQVDLVNTPFTDMPQALASGAVDAAAEVEPFASDIILKHLGYHFAYPYDQASGDLTNVVVVRKAFLQAHPEAVQAVVDGIVRLIPYLKTPAGRAAWAKVIEKYTGLGAPVVDRSLLHLVPDYTIPLRRLAYISAMMYDLHLVQHHDAKRLIRVVDYRFLERATHKTEAQLGGL